MFEQTNSDHYVNPDTVILGIKWTRKSMPIHFIWNKWRTIFEKKLLILCWSSRNNFRRCKAYSDAGDRWFETLFLNNTTWSEGEKQTSNSRWLQALCATYPPQKLLYWQNGLKIHSIHTPKPGPFFPLLFHKTLLHQISQLHARLIYSKCKHDYATSGLCHFPETNIFPPQSTDRQYIPYESFHFWSVPLTWSFDMNYKIQAHINIICVHPNVQKYLHEAWSGREEV